MEDPLPASLPTTLQASVYASSLSADPLSSPLHSAPASSPPSLAAPSAILSVSPAALSGSSASPNFSKSLASPSSSPPSNSLSPSQIPPSATDGRDNRNKPSHFTVSTPMEMEQGEERRTAPRDVTPSNLQQHSIITPITSIDSSTLRSPPPSSSPSSSSAAAVAPAPIHSSQPFSMSFQPISVRLSQGAQSTSAVATSASAAANAQLHPPPLPPSDLDTQKKNGKKNFEKKNNFLLSLFEKTFSLSSTSSSASSSSASSSSSSASALLTFSSLPQLSACHCLVVDESKLVDGSADEKAFRIALALERDPLCKHTEQWLNIPLSDISIAYVPKQQEKRLHINFRSLPALGQALLAHPFLVRCGSIGSAWSSTCGEVKKQALPELLQFSCVPSNPAGMEKLLPDVTQLLATMQLQYTSFWFPSKAAAAGANGKEDRIVFYVLPRNIAHLKEEVDRLHLKHELWGSRVRVQGMNDPVLHRCNQCDNLGHQPDACLKYSGLALRLIGKKPLPYSLMVELQERAGARAAFLGSSFDEMRPSRRLTLLFDIPTGTEEQHMTQLATHLLPLFAELHPILHGSVQCVDIKDRTKECKECGSLVRPHECPFVDLSRARRPQAPPSSSAAVAAAARSGSGVDEMCSSWRRTRTCERREKGISCKYAHPEEHTLKAKECFAFQRGGFCSNGTSCQYKHVQRGVEAGGNKPSSKPGERAPSSSSSSILLPPAGARNSVAAVSSSHTMVPPAPAAALSAPGPAGSPSKKKRGRGETTEVGSSSTAAAASNSSLDAMEVEDSDDTPAKFSRRRATSVKKSKQAVGVGIPTHTTVWGDMQASDEEDQERTSTPAASPIRASSLASIRSPSSTRAAPAVPPAARGHPRLSASPAAAAAAAAAQPAAPSRSSSTSRGAQ